MDNAGGHGSNAAVEEYTKMLKTEYNIEIIHQVPRSPFTNLLDLGVWCSLQSQVEHEHLGMRKDAEALCNTVFRTWENSTTLQTVIENVWGRLRNVMVLLEAGNGGNDLVETKRGKSHRDLELPETFLNDDINEATVGTNINRNANTNINGIIHGQNNIRDIESDNDNDDEDDVVETTMTDQEGITNDL